MNFFKIFLPLLILGFLVSSCSENKKENFLGRWKVEETGIKGLEITYEIKEGKIVIESRMDRIMADSLGEPLLKSIEFNYNVRTDSASLSILTVNDPENNVSGEYKISISENEMTLYDFQGEKTHLLKLKNNL
jgi:hypothetical protein